METMRRKDREITDETKIDAIIASAHCCRIGFNDNGKVYIVPLSFGCCNNGGTRIFYFHGAGEGRKINLIHSSPEVGFELDTNYELVTGDVPCSFSAKYSSVIGSGTVSIVYEDSEKLLGLGCIMKRYSGEDNRSFSEKALNSVCVFKLTVTDISCKEHN